MNNKDFSEDIEYEDDTQDHQSSLDDSQLSEDMNESIDIEEKYLEPSQMKIRTFQINGENFFLKKEIYEDMMSKLQNTVMDLLCLNLDDALIVFFSYNWSIDKLKDDYFSNQESLFDKLGFTDEQRETNKQNLKDQNEGGRKCSLCLNEKAEYEECKQGHSFCKECWLEYCKTKIANRIPVFRCMQEGCKSYFRHSQILKSLSNQDGGYKEVLVRLYTQGNKNLCLCPSPDCDYACEKLEGVVINSMKCACGTEFCFKCGELSHYPASCEQKQEFVDLLSKQDKDIAWIIVNTRLCPFCHRSVQKIEGCSQIICSYPCHKVFCYECEQPWDNKKEVPFQINHNYCKFYQKNNRVARYFFSDEEEQQYQITQDFILYSKKYQDCQVSLNTILDQKQHYVNEIRKVVSLKLKIDFMETKFLLEGFDLLLTSIRILQWSQVLEYFLDRKQSKGLKLFQDLVDQLADQCELLHAFLSADFKAITEELKYDNFTDETLAILFSKVDALKTNISCASIELKLTQKILFVSVENGSVDSD